MKDKYTSLVDGPYWVLNEDFLKMVGKGDKMIPYKIKVYDWNNVLSGGKPKEFDVRAYCVGGEKGVRAYFEMDGVLYEAKGWSDGYWRLVSTIDVSFIDEIIKALQQIADDNSGLY